METFIIKTALKNQYIFELTFWTKKEALGLLVRLCELYNPNGLAGSNMQAPLKSPDKKEFKDAFRDYRRKFQQSLKIIQGWKPQKRTTFLKEIDSLLEMTSLGKEWRLSLITAILQSWFFPPIYNLNIEETQKRVLLELNPDTSVDDIKAAWEEIARRKKQLWPNFKKMNLTKKTFLNFSVAVRDFIERVNPETKLDAVTRQPLKKDTDITRVGTLWPNEEDISEETDIRRVQRLRQIRHRTFKKR